MRLITHNMLKCNIKGVNNGYPLRIEAEKIEEIESEYNVELVKSMVQKVNLLGLISAATDLNVPEIDRLKALITENTISLTELEDENILKLIHKILFDIHISEGNLVCPETGRKFPVREGIPNMLLHEDEV